MATPFILRAVAASIVGLLVLAAEAPAKGVILITHGDTIAQLGDLSAQLGNPDSTVKVGFKSSYAGLFWIDLWTWGGEFCLYQDNTYQPIDRREAAALLGKTEDELQEPLLYRFPLGLMLLAGLAVLGGAVWVLGGIAQSLEKAKASRLLHDPIYEKALEIASAPPTAPAVPSQPAEAGALPVSASEEDKQVAPESAFEAGVRYLTDSGVSLEEAVRNLQLLMRCSPRQPQAA